MEEGRLKKSRHLVLFVVVVGCVVEKGLFKGKGIVQRREGDVFQRGRDGVIQRERDGVIQGKGMSLFKGKGMLSFKGKGMVSLLGDDTGTSLCLRLCLPGLSSLILDGLLCCTFFVV